MKALLPYFLFCLLCLPSCSVEDRLERREDRLVGSWELDRAFSHEDNELFRDNVTDDFRGDRITFFRDGTLEYRAGNGEFFVGTWFLDALREPDDDLEFTIDADFFDGRGFLAFRWIGVVNKLTNNNFNLDISERTGRLELRWDRI